MPKRIASRVFDPPDLSLPGRALSRAEIEFFQEHGFVAKKALLESEALAEAMRRIWAHLLDRVPFDKSAERIPRPRRPETWPDPAWAPMPPAPKAGPHAGRQRIVHAGAALKLHDLGAADYLLALLPNDPRVRQVAGALLGDLRPSRRTRGVYALFPSARRRTDAEAAVLDALAPHTDQVCQQLNACAYLEDVPPRGGGFTLYPGSHRIMHRAHRFAANWSPLPTFKDALRQVVETIEPRELIGARGDVIFWHGRAVHSPGAHLGGGIRWAVFADFMRDHPTMSDAEHRRLGQYEWFKDAKLLRDDQTAGEDMWRDWRLGEPR